MNSILVLSIFDSHVIFVCCLFLSYLNTSMLQKSDVLLEDGLIFYCTDNTPTPLSMYLSIDPVAFSLSLSSSYPFSFLTSHFLFFETWFHTANHAVLELTELTIY